MSDVAFYCSEVCQWASKIGYKIKEVSSGGVFAFQWQIVTERSYYRIVCAFAPTREQALLEACRKLVEVAS